MVDEKMKREAGSRLGLHALQFNVAQLLKEPSGASRSFELEGVTLPQFDDDLQLMQPLHGHIRLHHVGDGVLVTGQLETTLQMECSRCLSPIDVPVSVELEEEFRPRVDIISGALLPIEEGVEEANLISEQHILDLLEVVRQELWLAGPSMPLCKPDCRGLCLQCGQNLNEGDCDCPKEAIDHRWAGLQALKFDE